MNQDIKTIAYQATEIADLLSGMSWSLCFIALSAVVATCVYAYKVHEDLKDKK